MKKGIFKKSFFPLIVLLAFVVSLNAAPLVIQVHDGVYITNNQGLAVIDSETIEYVDRFSSSAYPSTVSRKSVAINSKTNTAYITNFSIGNTIYVHDLVTGNRIATLSAEFPVSAVVNENTNMIYFVELGQNRVMEIDGVTNTITGAVFNKPQVGALAIDADKNLLYATVGSETSGEIYLIDLGNNVPPYLFNTIGNNPNRPSLFEVTNPYVMVSCLNSGLLYILNNDTTNPATLLQTFATVTLSTGTSTNGNFDSVFNPLTNTIYVSNQTNGAIAVVTVTPGSPDTFVQTATITTGGAPRELIIDTRQNLIYVSNYSGSTDTHKIQVIDGATNTIIEEINIGPYPSGMALYTPTVVTFRMNDGTATVFSKVMIGNYLAVDVPASTPTRAGYDFVGWYETSVGLDPTETPFNFSTVLTADKTLYAGWREKQQVSIIYEPNGGLPSPFTRNFNVGDPMTISTLAETGISRPGFTFVGWNTQSDGLGTSYTPGTAVSLTTNLTLYAIWQPVSLPPTGDYSLVPIIGLMACSAIGSLLLNKRNKKH